MNIKENKIKNVLDFSNIYNYNSSDNNNSNMNYDNSFTNNNTNTNIHIINTYSNSNLRYLIINIYASLVFFKEFDSHSIYSICAKAGITHVIGLVFMLDFLNTSNDITIMHMLMKKREFKNIFILGTFITLIMMTIYGIYSYLQAKFCNKLYCCNKIEEII